MKTLLSKNGKQIGWIQPFGDYRWRAKSYRATKMQVFEQANDAAGWVRRKAGSPDRSSRRAI